MAITRGRRPLNLRLPLPDVSDSGHRFPPSATTSAVAASSVTIPSSELERLGVLGHGNGGTVYKVQHRTTSRIYAMKVVRDDGDLKARRQVFRERDILRRTDSPHIVRCYETYEKPSGDVVLLMEYMDAGSLDTLLRTKGAFSESQLAPITRQILKGLSYLHSHKIMHRDLKPSNLLVNNKMEVKIADFGVSKVLSPTLEACNSYVGTWAYMSPERFDPGANGGNYDGFLGDIWSLGLIVMELFLGHFPLLPAGQKPDFPALMCSICFGEPPVLPPGASDEFRHFTGCCLQKEPRKRWTASQLLEHPFLVKYSAA